MLIWTYVNLNDQGKMEPSSWACRKPKDILKTAATSLTWGEASKRLNHYTELRVLRVEERWLQLMLALSITLPEINSPSVFEVWIRDWRWYCILLLDPCPSHMEAHSWAQEQLLLIAGAKAEQRKATSACHGDRYPSDLGRHEVYFSAFLPRTNTHRDS